MEEQKRTTSLSKEDIEKIVISCLPKEHEKLHLETSRFLEHAPEAKMHGDHHDFTESIRSKIEHTIVSIFKGLGGIILLALAIGLYTWVKTQVGVK